MNQLIDRMLRAAKLDANVYEEVEADKSSMGQAIGVVVLSSLAAGIAAVGNMGVMGIIAGTVGALAGWIIWAFLTYIIGTKLLPEPQTSADMGELMRTIGFSSAPGVIRILGIIPAIQPIVGLIAAVWMLVAMVVAVRQALDYHSTGRAVGVCVIGWLIQMAVLLALFAALSPGDGAA
jgi:hypothetical protein